MDTWQIQLVLAVGIPAILATSYLWIRHSTGASKSDEKRGQACPSCGARALTFVVRILAHPVALGGEGPDNWTYFLCEACGAHWKQIHGEFVIPSKQEWAEYCAEILRAKRGQG